MQNYEIVRITNAYNLEKASIAYSKKEGKQVEEVALPAAVAWKRRINFDKLIAARKLIDEALKELEDRFADDEHSFMDGGVRKVKTEYMPDFEKTYKEILEQETDVDIKKVKLSELEGLTISDSYMDTFVFMIEE